MPMKLPTLTPTGAVVHGALAAGILDLAAVFAFWAAKGVPPADILRSIASSLLGAAAAQGGTGAATLGLFLHFFVSFVFAAAYVAASSRMTVLRSRFAVYGIAYGLLAYLVMAFVVVPLSRAQFGAWPPPPLNLAVSLFIHLFLFGLPIAFAASRIGRGPTAAA